MLIVDDNAYFLEAAADLLKREGLIVLGVASDTANALRLTRELHPDVVLVDIMLGRESGIDLARRLAEANSGGPRHHLDLHARGGGFRGPYPGGAGGRVRAKVGAVGQRHPAPRGSLSRIRLPTRNGRRSRPPLPGGRPGGFSASLSTCRRGPRVGT